MNFEIETSALSAALRVASVAMTGKSTLPILGNILIEAEKDFVAISATNLDLYVRQKSNAVVKKIGAITAPFSLLQALTGRMQASKVKIELKGKELEFRSGEFTGSLETLPAEEFPPRTTFPSEGKDCDAADIVKPFTMLSHAMADDDKKGYHLMGINLSSGGQFAASDARRAAFYFGEDLTPDNFIIPSGFVNAILKIQPEGEAKFFSGNGNVTLVSKDTEVTSKLVEASFPKVHGLIPGPSKSAYSCGRKELIHALQTCGIFCAPNQPGINIHGSGKEVEISIGKARQVLLGTELENQSLIKIKLDHRFLVECLSVLEGDSCRIQVADGKGPALIEEGNFKEVIMPMRT